MANQAPDAGGVPSGADAVTWALTQRGKPYVWGATGPNSYDCSGLVQAAYKHIGLTTPRTTSDMVGSKSNLQRINKADLQAGDLIFSNWTGSPSSHVGIYTGDGSIIEAPEPGKNVMVTKLGPGYWSHADNYRRVPGVSGGGGAAPADPGIGGVLGDIGNALLAPLGWIPTPGNVTEALTNVGAGVGSVAQSAASVAGVASLITKAFLPSNMIRGFALMFGSVFILIGIWFLGREIKDAS